ncbi:MAG: hypothetical protein LUI60_05340 [Clostridia bacterium]|nr:hypothetical protein [Clostridia bacterium]
MKIYFLSDVKAALKLDGEYVGIIDGFERWCDIDAGKGVLAEIIPDGNLQPVNFFISEKFFASPPAFADVYISDYADAIYLRRFAGKDACLNIILQRLFCGVTVTVYRQCNIFVSCEGETFETYPLPDCYENARAEEVTCGGQKFLALYGGKWLTLINSRGKIVFMNVVESCSFGNTLEVTAPLYGCADCYAECVFSYGGDKFTAVNSRVAERHPQGKELLPFVFFERVLYGADCAAMLDGSLAPKAESLKKYLGRFTAVTVPCGDFYAAEGDINAAGLVYPKGGNLYQILYFALDVQDGKITNIRPV